jgi:uncharacterized protein (DUF433 family)
MALQETLIAAPIPLKLDQDGVLRVGGTRVTLDTVVHAYERGETPEEIAINFDTLKLPDIYAVIGYYLRHKDVVGLYLMEREKRAEEVRRQATPLLPSRDLRDRLLARSKTAT